MDGSLILPTIRHVLFGSSSDQKQESESERERRREREIAPLKIRFFLFWNWPELIYKYLFFLSLFFSLSSFFFEPLFVPPSLFFLFFFIIRRWVIAPLDSSRCNWTDFGRDGNDPHTPVAGRCPPPCERPLHAKCETVRFEIRARWIEERRSRLCSFPTFFDPSSVLERSQLRDRGRKGMSG